MSALPSSGSALPLPPGRDALAIATWRAPGILGAEGTHATTLTSAESTGVVLAALVLVLSSTAAVLLSRRRERRRRSRKTSHRKD